MRRQRKCLVWHAIPNCGKPIKFSGRWLKNDVWDKPFARRMSVRILARLESLSLIHSLVGRDPTVQDVPIAAGAWWDVVTMPRIHCQRIIYILQKSRVQRFRLR